MSISLEMQSANAAEAEMATLIRKLAAEAELCSSDKVLTFVRLVLPKLSRGAGKTWAPLLLRGRFLDLYLAFWAQFFSLEGHQIQKAGESGAGLTQVLCLMVHHSEEAAVAIFSGQISVARVLLKLVNQRDSQTFRLHLSAWRLSVVEAGLYALFLGLNEGGAAAVVQLRRHDFVPVLLPFASAEAPEHQALRASAALILASAADPNKLPFHLTLHLLSLARYFLSTPGFLSSAKKEGKVEMAGRLGVEPKFYPFPLILGALNRMTSSSAGVADRLGRMDSALDVVASLLGAKEFASFGLDWLGFVALRPLPAAAIAQSSGIVSKLKKLKGTEAERRMAAAVLLSAGVLKKTKSKDSIVVISTASESLEPIVSALAELVKEDAWTPVIVSSQSSFDDVSRVPTGKLFIAVLDNTYGADVVCRSVFNFQCKQRMPFVPIIGPGGFKPVGEMAKIMSNFTPIAIRDSDDLLSKKWEVLRRFPPKN